ncbi:MAG: hypothetical protein EOM17_10980 [Synergistales bacterium]|nr:hypothetical protein [Synergistales bacterium]
MKKNLSAEKMRRNPDGTWRKPEAPEIKDNEKRRPKDIDGILAAFQEGTLDQRTKTAMQFNAVKEALGEDPEKVAAALLRHDVSVFAIVNRAILDFVQANQGQLISDGGVIPEMLIKDFPKFQAAQTKALEALIKIERKQGRKGDSLDVADAVLDITSNQVER